jgi:cobalt-precorrin 5A hydrolase
MKTAIIAVSRDGLKMGKRLLDLYPQASIYVPPRLLADAVNYVQAQKNRILSDGELSLLSSTSESEQQSNRYTIEQSEQQFPFSSEEKVQESPLHPEEEAHENSLPLSGKAEGDSLSLEGRAQEISLPLEGGGAGWGCTLHSLSGSFKIAIAGLFNQYQLLIFISATAVAVRAIAPCLQGKDKDPAVVVIDDQGRFVISLLSGHLGGANEAAEKIAHFLDACPVVTTATDGRGITAFDDLARKLGWHIENLPDLKKISAALLEDREIMLYSRQQFAPALEGNIYVTESSEDLARAEHGVVIVDNRLALSSVPKGVPVITLRPRNVAAGVGCRRGIPAEAIIRAIENAFAKAGLSLTSLSCLASGEFKADESGLIDAARHFAVPLKIFTREELIAAIGDSATSTFVEEQVGVGAVAEPCARLGSGGGPLLLEIQRGAGITVALAESPSNPSKP